MFKYVKPRDFVHLFYRYAQSSEISRKLFFSRVLRFHSKALRIVYRDFFTQIVWKSDFKNSLEVNTQFFVCYSKIFKYIVMQSNM